MKNYTTPRSLSDAQFTTGYPSRYPEDRSMLANPYFWQLAGAALLIWLCIGIGLYAFFFGGAK